MHIGFTGSRRGLTLRQANALWWLLKTLYWQEPSSTFHHGDCVGADERAFGYANTLGYHTIAHPPDYDGLRAFTASDEIREPKYFHDRNRDIVNECGLLIACPNTLVEQIRSGTWSTVRKGREVHRPRIILLP